MHATSESPVTDQNHDHGTALEINAASLNLAVHDGVLTLVSPRTGDHRTFRIRSVEDTPEAGYFAGKRIVELLVGPDNGADYVPFGFCAGADDCMPGKVRVWKRFRGTVSAKSDWEKFADLLERPGHWAAKGVTYAMALACRRCGRQLTHPTSLADGLGPVCREKVGL